jgi:hypothetical protein
MLVTLQQHLQKILHFVSADGALTGSRGRALQPKYIAYAKTAADSTK